MEITIHDSYTLKEIQEEFANHFPFLKLEFFEFGPGEKKIFSKENLITATDKTIGETRHVHTAGHLRINGQQKVVTLENHFRDSFGMYVQVFRKSGNTWLQTTNTDHWTLSEQNRKGKEIETNVKEQVAVDFEQYYEQM
ncbi:MAG: hypothetical protein K0Q95_3372 [Bacteroidota bacterium]|jgi:hypothetical protein|nr:hypothetical protein [Bacteroidota bacterium]